ncbi:hypothetical protein D3C85_1087700 [compost metagenome]
MAFVDCSFLIAVSLMTHNFVRYCSSWNRYGPLCGKNTKNEESTDKPILFPDDFY